MQRCATRIVFTCLFAGIVAGCESAARVDTSAGSGSGSSSATSTTDAGASASSGATNFIKQPGPPDPDAPTEFTTTETGLKYRVLRKGTGDKPVASSRVTVNYKGWLDDGTVFDTNYHRYPFSFGVAGEGERREVIVGWNEGITYVGEGGMIELEVPSELAYGRNGNPPDIPGNATLHFLVEVISVE